MTLRFTPPPHVPSLLSRLDPRWKLAAIALAAVAAAVVHTWPAAAAALAGAVLLGLLGRLPFRWWATRLAPAVLFVAVFAAPPVFFGASAVTAVVLVCKAAALVTLALVLLATAPLDATLKAAHALHAPGLLVQLTLMSYRYLFLLADELGRLRIALRLRGYRNRANLHSYRTIGAVTGRKVAGGCRACWERAEPRSARPCAAAASTGRFRSLSTAFRTTAADVLAFAVIVATAAGVCVLDWLCGYQLMAVS